MKPGSEAAALFELYERKYRPDQLRDELGRWADEGGGGSSAPETPAASGEPTAGSGRSDPRVLSDMPPANYFKPGADLAQNDSASGYSVDLRTEDQRGGHTIANHVGKSEAYLLNLVQQQALSSMRRGDYADGLREGSFPSLEAANKLVSSTIAQNPS